MKYIGTKQASKILGVNQSRIRQLILSGEIKAVKIGKTWLINPRHIEKLRAIRAIGTTN